MPTTDRSQNPFSAQRSQVFLRWLDDWLQTRDVLPLSILIERAGGAGHVALVLVDVIDGFCTDGPLASERVGNIVEPIARLVSAADYVGVGRLACLRDAHHPQAVEFDYYPPHSVHGSAESELVAPLARLREQRQHLVWSDFPKNSIAAWAAGEGGDQPTFRQWVAACRQGGVSTFVVAGDCTDLCTYHAAMGIRLLANERNEIGIRVVVPLDCVQTYDLPVAVAKRLDALPHDGDLMHAVFAYQMALNGVEVVASLT